MIVFNVLTQSASVTDKRVEKQTDRQTDCRFAIASRTSNERILQ